MPETGSLPDRTATFGVPNTTGGMNPPTGGPGNYNFGNTGNPNPTMTSSNPYGYSVPQSGTVPMGIQQPWNPGAAMPPTGGPVTATSTGGPNAPVGSGTAPITVGADPGGLHDTFGTGTGNLIWNYLNSNGGYNSALTQQSIDAQIQAMQQQIARGWGNIETNLGASGTSINSSTAGLAAGDYFSQATSEENALIANEYFNMWNSSQNREASVLQSIEGPTAQHQQNSSFLSQLGQVGGFMQDMSSLFSYSSQDGWSVGQ